METIEYNEFVDENEEVLQNPEAQDLVSIQIAGFWRRIMAFLFDLILIVTFSRGLGALFFDQFAIMGEWGRLIGMTIFLAYFGFLNSGHGGGQTLGKRIGRIRCVNEVGDLITLRRSMLRSLVLGLPQILNGWSMEIKNSLLIILFGLFVGLIVFGAGSGIFYFYVFNRNSRQSLHDLICRTYVVSATGSGPVETAPVWRGHYITYCVLLVLIAGGIIGGNNAFKQSDIFKQTNTIYEQVMEVEGVYSSLVVKSVTRSLFNGWQSTTLKITARVRDKWLLNEEYVKKVYSSALKDCTDIPNVDFIEVIIVYQYDIGTARGYQNIAAKYSPNEWKEYAK